MKAVVFHGIGPAARQAEGEKPRREQELKLIAPQAKREGDQWRAGDAPSQALDWAARHAAQGRVS